MRVQPHLPSRPFTAITTSSSGRACFACSAASRPAPPAPRIRMSVASVGSERPALVMAAASFARAEFCQDGGALGGGVLLNARRERAAVGVHGDQQRPELPDAETPQAL